MVSLRKGTPAYKLLLRKEKEQAERQKEAYAKGEGNCNEGAEYSGGHQVCKVRRKLPAGHEDGAEETRNRV